MMAAGTIHVAVPFAFARGRRDVEFELSVANEVAMPHMQVHTRTQTHAFYEESMVSVDIFVT